MNLLTNSPVIFNCQVCFFFGIEVFERILLSSVLNRELMAELFGRNLCELALKVRDLVPALFNFI